MMNRRKFLPLSSTRYFLDWKKMENIKPDQARLFGRSNLSPALLNLPVDCILLIWEYLPQDNLVQCMILFELFQCVMSAGRTSLSPEKVKTLKTAIRSTIEPLLANERQRRTTLHLALTLGTNAYKDEVITYFAKQLHGCYSLFVNSKGNRAHDIYDYEYSYTQGKKYLTVLESHDCTQWIKSRYASNETKRHYQDSVRTAHRYFDDSNGIHPSRYSRCVLL